MEENKTVVAEETAVNTEVPQTEPAQAEVIELENNK